MTFSPGLNPGHNQFNSFVLSLKNEIISDLASKFIHRHFRSQTWYHNGDSECSSLGHRLKIETKKIPVILGLKTETHIDPVSDLVLKFESCSRTSLIHTCRHYTLHYHKVYTDEILIIFSFNKFVYQISQNYWIKVKAQVWYLWLWIYEIFWL